MYQVKVEVRGPEGIRIYKQFRLTEAGAEELERRMADPNVAMADLLTGIELQHADTVGELVAPNALAAGKKRNTTAGK